MRPNKLRVRVSPARAEHIVHRCLRGPWDRVRGDHGRIRDVRALGRPQLRCFRHGPALHMCAHLRRWPALPCALRMHLRSMFGLMPASGLTLKPTRRVREKSGASGAIVRAGSVQPVDSLTPIADFRVGSWNGRALRATRAPRAPRVIRAQAASPNRATGKPRARTQWLGRKCHTSLRTRCCRRPCPRSSACSQNRTRAEDCPQGLSHRHRTSTLLRRDPSRSRSARIPPRQDRNPCIAGARSHRNIPPRGYWRTHRSTGR